MEGPGELDQLIHVCLVDQESREIDAFAVLITTPQTMTLFVCESFHGGAKKKSAGSASQKPF